MAYASMSTEIDNFNLIKAEKEIEKILLQLESFSSVNNLSDTIYTVSSNNVSLKNMHYEIARALIDLNVVNLSSVLFELFKNKFNDYYINQDKYRKVIYNNTLKEIQFETLNKSAQLIYIKFKQNDDYEIEVMDTLHAPLDNEYDYHLFYLVDNNPIIKSGFVFIDSKYKINTHSITIEEAE